MHFQYNLPSCLMHTEHTLDSPMDMSIHLDSSHLQSIQQRILGTAQSLQLYKCHLAAVALVASVVA